MKVTNEQARQRIYDLDIRAENRLLSANETVIHELCSDLLEAREKADVIAKIAVLEEAREMFNALDEMNPVDYSDSFNVINALIEKIKKVK